MNSKLILPRSGGYGRIPRYSTTDHRIQESIKWIFNSGIYQAVGAAEKKKIQTAISMLLLRPVFFYVFMAKKPFLKKYCSIRTKKLHRIEVRKILKSFGKYFILD